VFSLGRNSKGFVVQGTLSHCFPKTRDKINRNDTINILLLLPP
jgi:hypothetical protein